jgi:hypothetical protein
MGKRGSVLRCAYIDCKKTTDKKSFGHVNKLSDHHCVSYSAWLKQQHDGAVRNGQCVVLCSPTCCCGVQGCPSLLLSSQCDHRSVPCMDCV